MILPRLRKLALASALALLTAACGGGGGDDVASGGIGGTGITSGSITGFGSIFVNGFELDLSGAAITIDDQAGSEGDLRLGMVVNAVVQYNDDGKTGSALAVEVEESLEGPITSVTPPVNGIRTAIILGVTVVISQDETVIDDSPDLSFDNINAGDVLEVYGFFNENDELEATRLEKTGSGGIGSNVEIKGNIKNLSGSTPPGTFKLRNVTVHFFDEPATLIENIPGGELTEGLFVEVKGTLRADGGVDASNIEAKKPGDDIEKVSIEGIIASVDPGDARLFVLNTVVGPIPVNAMGAAFDPVGLVPVPGLEVEVEGASVGGTLVAAKVKIDIQIRVEATVHAKSGGGSSGSVTLFLNPDPTVSVQTLTVEVNDSTKMIDQTGAIIPPSNLNLDAINPMVDFLKIKVLQRDDGKLVAAQIRRTDSDDVLLQGPADLPPTGDPGLSGRLVSVLGVQFDTDANTKYEGFDDNPITDPDEFFNDVKPGSPVKIKDKAPTIDGVLEEAGFED